ncbi:MAG TPA: response regulator [Candidatus Angelobacter sp.]|nr:response regulator [Candidatus Angelobacter sp.]
MGVTGLDLDVSGVPHQRSPLESQLQATLNIVPAHAWYALPNGELKFVNGRTADYLGLPKDHSLRFGTGAGAAWDSHIVFLHPDDREETRRVWAECLRTGSVGEVSFRARNAEGGYRWFLSRAEPVRAANGDLLHWIGVNLDIEERKQAEFYLAEGQRLTHTGSWAFTPTGFEYWSSELFHIHGLDPKGNPPTTEEYLALVHPEDRESVVWQIQEMLATHRVCDFTKRIVRPDGQIRTVRCVGVPATTQEGTFQRYVGTGMDVTEQEHLIKALRKSEEELEKRVWERTQEISVQKLRFQQLFENAPVGIVMLDAQGRVIAVNRVFEAMFQFTSEELFHKRIIDAIVPDSHRAESEDIASRLRLSQFGRWETIRRRRDGSLIPVEMYGVPIASEGRMEGMYGMYVDISQRKHTQDELKKAKESAESANYAKSVFLATMSHEIRTPMNGILGLTELLLDTPLTPEQRSDLGMVKTSADSLLTVINDVLDFSKIEAGKLEFERTSFDLRQTLGEAMRPLAFQSGKKNLELVFEVGARVPQMVIGDPVRLTQVLANLVGNAIKFTERGEIVVRVNQQASDPQGVEIADQNTVCLHISVADTGIGIPPDKQKAIFESFTQAEDSTTRKYGGTGLGLAICSRLLEGMGGRIWVENRQPGSVFHFTVRLRAGKEGSSHHAVPQETEALRGLRVLIVDDNAASRHQLTEMLVNWGMTPTDVETGSFAVQTLSKAERLGKSFQLVLLDTHMPEMDGFTVAEKIRRSPGSRHVPVIMLTSGCSSSDAVRSRELNISGYVTKPVLEAELLSAIRASVGAQVSDKLAACAVSSAGNSNGRRRMRLLLVEDNRVNQVLATRILEKHGHHVRVASNGREAIAILTSHTFDLVLMDIEMPEMDGLEATRVIRQNEKPGGKHLPIIAMTAHAMTGDKDKYLTAGMDDYISKPVHPKQMLDTIERLGACEGQAHPEIHSDREAANF